MHFFHGNEAMHTDSTRPSPGALLPRPCDASWSLPRLLHCGRLGAASQAATGTAATPQLPLKLLLLLLRAGLLLRIAEKTQKNDARAATAARSGA